MQVRLLEYAVACVFLCSVLVPPIVFAIDTAVLALARWLELARGRASTGGLVRDRREPRPSYELYSIDEFLHSSLGAV